MASSIEKRAEKRRRTSSGGFLGTRFAPVNPIGYEYGVPLLSVYKKHKWAGVV